MHNTCWRVRQTTRNLPLHRHQGLYNTTVSEFWRFFASTVLIQVICHCNCQECNAYINAASTNDLSAGNLPHLITATSHGRGFFPCSSSQNNHSTVRQQPLCSLIGSTVPQQHSCLQWRHARGSWLKACRNKTTWLTLFEKRTNALRKCCIWPWQQCRLP